VLENEKNQGRDAKDLVSLWMVCGYCLECAGGACVLSEVVK